MSSRTGLELRPFFIIILINENNIGPVDTILVLNLLCDIVGSSEESFYFLYLSHEGIS